MGERAVDVDAELVGGGGTSTLGGWMEDWGGGRPLEVDVGRDEEEEEGFVRLVEVRFREEGMVGKGSGRPCPRCRA